MDRKYFTGFVISVLLIIAGNAGAEEKHFLTVDELVNNGYHRLTGLQISEIMNNHVIEVVDIETEAVSISERTQSEAGMARKFKDVQADKSLYFLDTRLLARAPALEGRVERKVVGDELIASDGVRTYHYSVYEKQGNMFAVRDIDHGNVFYEVIVK